MERSASRLAGMLRSRFRSVVAKGPWRDYVLKLFVLANEFKESMPAGAKGQELTAKSFLHNEPQSAPAARTAVILGSAARALQQLALFAARYKPLQPRAFS